MKVSSEANLGEPTEVRLEDLVEKIENDIQAVRSETLESDKLILERISEIEALFSLSASERKRFQDNNQFTYEKIDFAKYVVEVLDPPTVEAVKKIRTKLVAALKDKFSLVDVPPTGPPPENAKYFSISVGPELPDKFLSEFFKALSPFRDQLATVRLSTSPSYATKIFVFSRSNGVKHHKGVALGHDGNWTNLTSSSVDDGRSIVNFIRDNQ